MKKRGWKYKLFLSSLCVHRFIARKWNSDLYIEPCRNNPSCVLDDYEPRRAVLELSSREIYRYGIEGSTAELGVFRGDFAKDINHHFPDRKLYLFDTFEGFDSRDAEQEKAKNFSDASQDWSGTSEELVLGKMEHKENCIIRNEEYNGARQAVKEFSDKNNTGYVCISDVWGSAVITR
ncbi:MAG: hypothetical protein IJG34_07750 [Synergistaceae bacterium]|nr:hypothetical protein [Synergistaceae bacterium]MBQ3449767.1 hypothetical protein [Synergistaceae bacterium]MBQ3693623.1 hypothetical protein [Synergistaceae bacterium]MBQ9628595.1 hypothetical protein [Synergistaceae bacterium]MBR0069773.1 hypothetical protein [Synergistaceae bacterium]